LPGFAFFNIESAIANGIPRAQAIKDRADHYVEALKTTMGEDRSEQAVVSSNTSSGSCTTGSTASNTGDTVNQWITSASRNCSR
jgi:hypothetical protein